MANYLVTGGAGFIGSHLVDTLIQENHQVTILDNLSTGKRENVNSKAKLVIGDIRDSQLVEQCMGGKSGCFHLAAVASVQQSITQWQYTHEVNSTGTVNILDAAAKVNAIAIPVVYASSAAVYGDNDDVPLKESAVVNPLSAYGADKLSCEHHARVAGVVHQVPTIGFRFFNVFGPRQDPSSPYSGVISIFAERVKKNQSLTIFGDGKQTRDFVFVADVVAHLIAGMSRADITAKVFNVCTGKSTTINQLAKIIYRIAGKQSQINYQKARTGDIKISLGDPKCAIFALKVRAEKPVEEGLCITLGKSFEAAT